MAGRWGELKQSLRLDVIHFGAPFVNFLWQQYAEIWNIRIYVELRVPNAHCRKFPVVNAGLFRILLIGLPRLTYLDRTAIRRLVMPNVDYSLIYQARKFITGENVHNVNTWIFCYENSQPPCQMRYEQLLRQFVGTNSLLLGVRIMGETGPGSRIRRSARCDT
jgi:hypothetical protein